MFFPALGSSSAVTRTSHCWHKEGDPSRIAFVHQKSAALLARLMKWVLKT